MWTLIYKDVLMAKKALIEMVIFTLIFTIIGIFNGYKLDVVSASILIIGFSFFITSAEIDERDNSRRIIHSLPVTRKESIVSRYIGALILSAMSMTLIALLFSILKFIPNSPFKVFNVYSVLNSMVGVLIMSSLVMCIVYSFGYTAGRISNFIAFFILFPVYTGVFNQTTNGALKNIIDVLNSNNKTMILIKLFIAILIYLLSMTISITVYNNRDL